MSVTHFLFDLLMARTIVLIPNIRVVPDKI